VNLAVAYIGEKEYGKALRVLDPIAVGSRHIRSLRMLDAKAELPRGARPDEAGPEPRGGGGIREDAALLPGAHGGEGNLGLLYVGRRTTWIEGSISSSGPSRANGTPIGA